MSSRGRRFAKNVSASLVGQAALAVLGFVLTPLVIRSLGLELYGLYVLLQAAANYLLVGTLGAGSAGIKFAAEHASAGGRGLREAVRYTASMHLAGAGAACALLFAAAPWAAARLFNVGPDELAPAVFVLRCAAVGGIFAAGAQAAMSVLQGLQAFSTQNLVAVLQAGGLTIGTAALAALGLGVNNIARWHVAWHAAACAVAVWAAWLLAREPLARTGGRPLARRAFLAYALTMWAGSLAWLVTFQADKVVIAGAVSLSALTLYAVPAGLLQRLQLLPAVVSNVLVPMFSEVAEGPERELIIRRMYLKATRFVLWAAAPPLVFLLAVMPQFLGLWLGGQFSDRGVVPARLLVVANAFLLLNYIPNALAAGRGRPWYLSIAAWAQALVSVGAWWVLVPRLELVGVALGSLLAQALPAVGNVAAANRLAGVRWSEYLASAILRPAASAAVMLCVVFPPHALATTWPRMILLGMAGLAAFYGAAFALLSEEDRAHVRDLRRRL